MDQEKVVEEEEQYVLDEYPEDNAEQPKSKSKPKSKSMYSCYYCGLRTDVEMKSIRILELGDTEVFVCQNYQLKI
jgi:hypothetical protein